MDKVIVHCDMDNYYASVECLLNPDLINKPIAVCGSQDDRRGIVLAKNNLAKSKLVKTGDTIWQAKQKCNNIVIIPPNFKEYYKYSELSKEIYKRFTDDIESMGLDECWLDITKLSYDFNDGIEIAKKIKKIIKEELGLTISVGVSFNKIFSKLASDMNKPDGFTVISRENYKKVIWKKPILDLFGIGKKSSQILKKYGINTIGDLANQSVSTLKSILGTQGVKLYEFANGDDTNILSGFVSNSEIKSIGHGTTLKKDLKTEEEVWKVMLDLTKEISYRLKQNKKRAKGIQIQIKNNKLITKNFQTKFEMSEQSSFRLAEKSFLLFKKMYKWENYVRAVTIQAINLINENENEQKNLFSKNENIEKIEKLEKQIDKINQKYGKEIIYNAIFLEKK